eukprot:7133307-Heterocapsa_arctica.AAC.1
MVPRLACDRLDIRSIDRVRLPLVPRVHNKASELAQRELSCCSLGLVDQLLREELRGKERRDGVDKARL